VDQVQKRKSGAMNMVTGRAAGLIEHARAMIPSLLERAAADEQNRCVSRQSVEEIKKAGLIRVLRPARWGGYELPPTVLADISMALAEGDMCVAWIYGLFANHGYHLAFYEDRAQEDVWSEKEDAIVGSSYSPAGQATPVNGGYQLSGRWKFSSGSAHADWFLLSSIASNEPNEVICFLVPRKDCEIIDVWRVTGLESTGSNDIRVENAYVPGHRILRFSDLFRGTSPGTNPGPLYRLSPIQVFYRVITMPMIGALQAMTDEFVAAGMNRSTSSGPIAKNADALLAVGQAIAAIEEMKVVQRHTFERLLDLAGRGESASMSDRLRYRYQSSFVAETCVINAKALFEAAGAGAMMEETMNMGRIYRNLICARQHIGSQFRKYARTVAADRFGEKSTEIML
jgi:3-hydroxy-9,10-secoandrosta-1,3,5(10)-triene-9,17-dione monooxygenase